jgi:hypothetical protein
MLFLSAINFCLVFFGFEFEDEVEDFNIFTKFVRVLLSGTMDDIIYGMICFTSHKETQFHN